MDAVTQSKAKAGKGKTRQERPGCPRGLLRPHLQARHGAALGCAERHHPGTAEDGVRAGDLALQGRAALRLGSRLHHHRPGGVAARAGAGKPAAARQVAHHAIALRRPAAHPAGRDRAAAPPRRLGDPLHPRRRGRLHPGRRREDHHVAGRFRADAVLDHPRPRQHLEEVDDVARRAGRADGQLLRDEFLRALRRGEAEHQARPRGTR